MTLTITRIAVVARWQFTIHAYRKIIRQGRARQQTNGTDARTISQDSMKTIGSFKYEVSDLESRVLHRHELQRIITRRLI